MPIQREFINWGRPALDGAAEVLRARFEKAGEWDLSGVIVVVPGGRAGRRLLEVLVEIGEERKLILVPPAIVTPEAFSELLYAAKRPFADVLTQQLAWVEALRGAPPETLEPLLPFPPPADDLPRWLAIGQTLGRLHVELAADGLDRASVLKAAGAVEGFAEHVRWEALRKLQRAYLDALDARGLWDVQTARLVAIEKREIATDKQIVLVGTVDLNRTQRRMLDAVAERVIAIVVAPREIAERFDEHGCLVAAKWIAEELPLADEQIERADGPADQAETVTQWLASLGGKYRADEIAIGLPDEKLASQIERQLGQHGIVGRWAIGRKIVETGPYRLLKVAADYAGRGRFRDLASLVRHPDVYEWLVKQLTARGSAIAEPLTTLDEFASDRLPAQLDPERLAKEEKDEKAAKVLAVHRAAQQLVQPLVEKAKPLAEWAEALRNVLAAIYGTRQLDLNQTADRYLQKSLEVMARGLDGLSRIPVDLQPVVDCRQACRMVLEGVAGEGIPPAAGPEQIELLGWLDLPLDDAPAAIVTTFNEGWVPSSSTADSYLPNRLREAVGLLDNDRRLARDAYALALLLASRRELKVIVARRDSDGNPLAPSRLLFMTDADKAVKRAGRFFGELPTQGPRRNLLLPPGSPPPKPRITPPRPEPLTAPLSGLSVTKFRDYIACPYRFYLRHMLGLRRIEDTAEELDGGAFGGLAHVVLEQFGRAEEAKKVRSESNPEKIAEYLQDKVTQIAAARFGKQYARPAVLVQVEQIRLRLGAFAEWQAGRNREGWRIVFSENSDDPRLLKTDWPVDGESFTLQGRIDRIDYHESLRRLCIVDYKTADRGDRPGQTHRRGEEWVDLQLPLYRHLVREAKLPAGVPLDAPVELGYIVLPLDLKSAGLMLTDWDEGMLRSADERAREIVRAIRAGMFWPPKMPPPDFFDDVAVICQDRRMGAGGFAAEGDAA